MVIFILYGQSFCRLKHILYKYFDIFWKYLKYFGVWPSQWTPVDYANHFCPLKHSKTLSLSWVMSEILQNILKIFENIWKYFENISPQWTPVVCANHFCLLEHSNTLSLSWVMSKILQNIRNISKNIWKYFMEIIIRDHY